MQSMIFNETNIFILSKMVALLKQSTGNRHKLSSERDITKLLTEVSVQEDEKMKAYFGRFLENLIPEQILELSDRGVDVPEQHMKKPGFFPSSMPRQYAYTPKQAAG